jgi:hypothetical protein
MKNKSNKEKGSDFEKKVVQHINSGSIWFQKGDASTKDFVIEIKFTEKNGYRLTTKTLQKIWCEALEANKLPLMIVGIKEDNVTWNLTINITKDIK